MEYRVINHDLDDSLQDAINGMSEKGWTMFKAFDPEYFKDQCRDQFMRVIWQREKKVEVLKRLESVPNVEINDIGSFQKS
jgi:hypothetical protein